LMRVSLPSRHAPGIPAFDFYFFARLVSRPVPQIEE